MNRRLPLYLVIDCSHSMRGEPIRSVQEGLDLLAADLRSDPVAMETVCVSIIAFSTTAKVILPLAEVLGIVVPQLEAKGKSNLGAALKLLAAQIDTEVRRSTAEQKGDWRPVIFVISDGGSSDSWIAPARVVRSHQDAGEWTVIAVGFGGKVHADRLQRLTPTVLLSTSREPESFARFLKWVSVSVSRSARTGGRADTGQEVPFPPGFVLCPP